MEGSAGVRQHDDARLPAIVVQDEQRAGFDRGSGASRPLKAFARYVFMPSREARQEASAIAASTVAPTTANAVGLDCQLVAPMVRFHDRRPALCPPCRQQFVLAREQAV